LSIILKGSAIPPTCLAVQSEGSGSEESSGTWDMTVVIDGKPRFLSDISASARVG
jgi:hypothetical protein